MGNVKTLKEEGEGNTPNPYFKKKTSNTFTISVRNYYYRENSHVRRDLNVPKINTYVKSTTIGYFISLEISCSHLIHELNSRFVKVKYSWLVKSFQAYYCRYAVLIEKNCAI